MKGFWYLVGFATLVTPVPAAAQTQPAPVKPVATAPSPVPSFPESPRVGFIDLERVASLTREGKAANATLDQLRSQKRAAVDERGKQVEALQTRLSQTESVLNAESRRQLQRQYDRAQVDLQRFTQDAQAEVQSTQTEMLHVFMQHLFPIVGLVASEKKLSAVFTVDSTTLWHDPALDISDEIAKRLDSATPPDPKQQ
jgi:outer membrane protein